MYYAEFRFSEFTTYQNAISIWSRVIALDDENEICNSVEKLPGRLK